MGGMGHIQVEIPGYKTMPGVIHQPIKYGDASENNMKKTNKAAFRAFFPIDVSRQVPYLVV